MGGINVWAVLVAALSSFVLGGLWYSPLLFQKVWLREANGGQPPRQGHPAAVFGLSFVLALVAAGLFAAYLGPDPGLGDAVLAGLGVGAVLVAGSFGINYLFNGRSFTLWLVDGGYHAAQFTLFGLVLGLWP